MTEDTIAPFPFAQVICKYITAEDLDSNPHCLTSCYQNLKYNVKTRRWSYESYTEDQSTTFFTQPSLPDTNGKYNSKDECVDLLGSKIPPGTYSYCSVKKKTDAVSFPSKKTNNKGCLMADGSTSKQTKLRISNHIQIKRNRCSEQVFNRDMPVIESHIDDIDGFLFWSFTTEQELASFCKTPTVDYRQRDGSVTKKQPSKKSALVSILRKFRREKNQMSIFKVPSRKSESSASR